MTIDTDWKPGPEPEKITLDRPYFLMAIAEVREDDDTRAAGWKHVGPCRRLRATCCGSRGELRYPEGTVKEVRIGGVSLWGAILTGPKPLGDIPIGTELWLLEVEASDFRESNTGQPRPIARPAPAPDPARDAGP